MLIINTLEQLLCGIVEIMLTVYTAHEHHRRVQDINFIRKPFAVTMNNIATKSVGEYNAQPYEVSANLHKKESRHVVY